MAGLFDDLIPAQPQTPLQSTAGVEPMAPARVPEAAPLPPPAPRPARAPGNLSAPQGGGMFGDLIGDLQPIAPPEAPAATKLGATSGEFLKGLIGGTISQNPQDAGSFLETAGRIFGSNALVEAGKSVHQWGAEAGKGYEPKIAQPQQVLAAYEQGGVKSAIDAGVDWILYGVGQGVSSMVPSIASGVAGRAAGPVVGAGIGGVVAGPPGAAVGARVGALVGPAVGAFGSSYIQNTGNTYAEIAQEFARQRGEKAEATESEKDYAAKVAALAGVPLAALDSVLETTIAKKLLGESGEQVRREIIKRVVSEFYKGAIREGITEGLQEGVQAGATSAATGKDYLTSETAWRILGGATIGGATGGTVSAATAPFMTPTGQPATPQQPQQPAAPGPATAGAPTGPAPTAPAAPGGTAGPAPGGPPTPPTMPTLKTEVEVAVPGAPPVRGLLVSEDTETGTVRVETPTGAVEVPTEFVKPAAPSAPPAPAGGPTPTPPPVPADEKDDLAAQLKRIRGILAESDPAKPQAPPAAQPFSAQEVGDAGNAVAAVLSRGGQMTPDKVARLEEVMARIRATDWRNMGLRGDQIAAVTAAERAWSQFKGETPTGPKAPEPAIDLGKARAIFAAGIKNRSLRVSTPEQLAKELKIPVPAATALLQEEAGRPSGLIRQVRGSTKVDKKTGAVTQSARAGTYAYRPKLDANQSLVEFLASNGGLRDTGGEIRDLGGDGWHQARPGRSKLINPEGMELDEAAQLATEAGYIGKPGDYGSDIDAATVLEAIGRELGGAPVMHPDHDPTKAPGYEREVKARSRDEIRRAAASRGINLDGMSDEDAEAVMDAVLTTETSQDPDEVAAAFDRVETLFIKYADAAFEPQESADEIPFPDSTAVDQAAEDLERAPGAGEGDRRSAAEDREGLGEPEADEGAAQAPRGGADGGPDRGEGGPEGDQPAGAGAAGRPVYQDVEDGDQPAGSFDGTGFEYANDDTIAHYAKVLGVKGATREEQIAGLEKLGAVAYQTGGIIGIPSADADALVSRLHQPAEIENKQFSELKRLISSNPETLEEEVRGLAWKVRVPFDFPKARDRDGYVSMSMATYGDQVRINSVSTDYEHSGGHGGGLPKSAVAKFIRAFAAYDVEAAGPQHRLDPDAISTPSGASEAQMQRLVDLIEKHPETIHRSPNQPNKSRHWFIKVPFKFDGALTDYAVASVFERDTGTHIEKLTSNYKTGMDHAAPNKENFAKFLRAFVQYDKAEPGEEPGVDKVKNVAGATDQFTLGGTEKSTAQALAAKDAQGNKPKVEQEFGGLFQPQGEGASQGGLFGDEPPKPKRTSESDKEKLALLEKQKLAATKTQKDAGGMFAGEKPKAKPEGKYDFRNFFPKEIFVEGRSSVYGTDTPTYRDIRGLHEETERALQGAANTIHWTTQVLETGIDINQTEPPKTEKARKELRERKLKERAEAQEEYDDTLGAYETAFGKEARDEFEAYAMREDTADYLIEPDEVLRAPTAKRWKADISIKQNKDGTWSAGAGYEIHGNSASGGGVNDWDRFSTRQEAINHTARFMIERRLEQKIKEEAGTHVAESAEAIRSWLRAQIKDAPTGGSAPKADELGSVSADELDRLIDEAAGKKPPHAIDRPEEMKRPKSDASDRKNPPSAVNASALPKDVDPDKVLVLMACSATKADTGGKRVDVFDLYDGPMWQTLRTHLGKVPRENVYILSGKHGFISTVAMSEPYEEKISAGKVDTLLERGIGEQQVIGGTAAKPTLGQTPLAVLLAKRVKWEAVIIAGSGEYRRAFDGLVNQFKEQGQILADAPVVAVQGAIGVQRKMLGEFLAQANGAAETKAPDKEAEKAAKKAKFVEDFHKRRRDKEALAEKLAAEHPNGIRFQNRDDPARKTLVGPDTAEPGKFRITYFTPEGQPRGHTVYNTYVEAIVYELATSDPILPASAPIEKTTKKQEADLGGILKSAASNGVDGVDQAFTGLFKLFGGNKLSSGFTFDEETWKQAKPHFEAAYKSFVAAGKDLREFVTFIVQNFGEGARVYLQKFREELAAKPLDPEKKYPKTATGPTKIEAPVDENVVPLTMDVADFKEITDEWAQLFADPEKQVRIGKAAGPYITPQEAEKKIEGWRSRVKEIRAKHSSENGNKWVLSLFDYTGTWAQPWADAGYNVLTFDIQNGEDIRDFSAEYFNDNTDIGEVYAILAACPCTDFASSGARHFAAKDADGRTEASKELVFQTLRTIEYFRPTVWALENPVGRIESLTGLPKWRMSFDPHNFGEDYTKKTLIWGNFNADLPTANVEPIAGSKMWSNYGGKSQATKNARSETPEGFALAFFLANNYHDMPVEMRLTGQYPEASGAVKAALKAGVPEARIHELMEDTYGNYEYEEARNALAAEVAGMAKGKKPAPPVSKSGSKDNLFDQQPEGLPTEALPDPVSPEAGAPVETPAANPATNPEHVLKIQKIVVEKSTTKNGKPVWEVTGNTFPHKTLLKDMGGRWYGPKKAWSFYDADPTQKIAEALAGTAVGSGAGGADRNAKLTSPDATGLSDVERDALRGREDARPDESGLGADRSQYVDASTVALLERGAKFGIPADVIAEQVEDVALINRAYQAGKPLFVVANEPGTGKTYVLGGVIRELRRAGARKIFYVTQSEDLIAQVQKDLKDYGLDGVEFVTYASLSKGIGADTTGAVILFDEAHNIKNTDAARGATGAALMAQAKFTVFASGTPFENPVEAKYLEPTGVFSSVGDHTTWAVIYGAGVREFKGANGEKVKVPVWIGGKAKVKDAQAARQWFVRQGIFTQRAKRLDPEKVVSNFVPTAVDQKWVDMYNRVNDAYEAALSQYRDDAGRPLDPKVYSSISMHRVGTVKRILEAAKVGKAIEEIKKALAAGNRVVTFIETKADREIGRFAMSGSKDRKTRYDYPAIQQMMAEWKAERAMARQMGDYSWSPPPFADFIVEIARAMHEHGVYYELPSVMDDVSAAFDSGTIALYTGAQTAGAASKNKADWLAGRKKLLIATMAKGGTGLSLHDTVGNQPTTQINLNFPWSSRQVVQVSGRVSRYGLASVARMDWIFASNIPFERTLSRRVGGRMRDHGATVLGLEIESVNKLEDWDFESGIDAQDIVIAKGSPEAVTAAGDELDPNEDPYKLAEALEVQRGKASDTSHGFFATPYPVAMLMTRIAAVRAGDRVLEPSAGHGALIRFVPDTKDVKVDAVEFRTDNAEHLRKMNRANTTVHRDDFLAWSERNGDLRYDVVLMNPPFEQLKGIGSQDAAHVRRAYNMLRDGGRLVAIMGEGPFFRQNKNDAEFREWLDEVGATTIKLPEQTFKNSGTGVNTRLVVIDKGGDTGATHLGAVDYDNIRDIEGLVSAREGMKYAIEPTAVTGLYSRLERAIEGAPFEVGNAARWIGHIRAAANKGLVSKTELDWTNIEAEIVELGRAPDIAGKIDKTDVLKILQEKGVDVEESEPSMGPNDRELREVGNAWSELTQVEATSQEIKARAKEMVEEDGEAIRDELADEQGVDRDEIHKSEIAERARERAAEELQTDDRQSYNPETGYTVRGSDDMGWFVIPPEGGEDAVEPSGGSFDSLSDAQEAADEAWARDDKNQEAALIYTGPDAKVGNWATRGGRKYRELLLNLRTASMNGRQISTHWDEYNPGGNEVAHLRGGEFDFADGKTGWLWDEFQSDWARALRERGSHADARERYRQRGEAAYEAAKAIYGRLVAIYGDKFAAKHPGDPIGEMRKVTAETTRLGALPLHERDELRKAKPWLHAIKSSLDQSEEARETRRLYDEYALRYAELGGANDPYEGVEDMPYKGDKWVELAVRRAILWAAQNGYERMAWVTGQTTKDRYNLEKLVKEFHYKKNPDGTYDVGFIRAGDNYGKMLGEGIAENALQGMVGKEVARAIIAGEGKPTNFAANNQTPDVRNTINVKDVKIGGEWADNLYDKQIPALVKKALKAWGAQISQSAVLPRHHRVVMERTYTPPGQQFRIFGLHSSSTPFESEAEAQAKADELNATEKQTVWSIDLPQELRDEVMRQGFPYLARAPKAAAPLNRTQQAEAARDQVYKTFLNTVRAIAPQADVKFVETLTAQGPNAAASGGKAGDRAMAGYLKGTIYAAYDAIDTARTAQAAARHEVIHFLKDAGFFHPKEWALLEQAALDGNWREEFGLPKTLNSLEESVAYKAMQWRPGMGNVSGGVARVLKKIRDFLERLGNALRGLGFQTAQDVMDAVMTGRIGKRSPGQREANIRAAIKYASQQVESDAKAFLEWFGKSKVVDGQGKPLVVYHGTMRGGFDQFARIRRAGFDGIGSWFSASADEAGAFAGYHGQPSEGLGGSIYPTYIRMENPLEFGSSDEFWKWAESYAAFHGTGMTEAEARKADSGHDNRLPRLDPEKVRERLRLGGKDGIIIRKGGVGDGFKTEADWFIALEPEQIKSIFNTGAWSLADPRMSYAAAWHGSPYDFEQFTTAKIGTGEGAQAYGWGLYFAGREAVARHYRDALQRRDTRDEVNQLVKGREILVTRGHYKLDVDVDTIELEMRKFDGLRNLIGNEEIVRAIVEVANGYDLETETWTDRAMAAMRRLDKLLPPKTPGRIYKVNLAPEENQYLLWDEELSKQPKVLAALKKLGIDVRAAAEDLAAPSIERVLGKDFYSWLSDELTPQMPPDSSGTPRGWGYVQRGDEGQKAASLALKAAGVPGIKYLDGTSRAPVADIDNLREMVAHWSDAVRKNPGDESVARILNRYKGQLEDAENPGYNYVIFDEADVSVETKYAIDYLAGQIELDGTRQLTKDELKQKHAERRFKAKGEERKIGATVNQKGTAGLGLFDAASGAGQGDLFDRTVAAVEKDQKILFAMADTARRAIEAARAQVTGDAQVPGNIEVREPETSNDISPFWRWLKVPSALFGGNKALQAFTFRSSRRMQEMQRSIHRLRVEFDAARAGLSEAQSEALDAVLWAGEADETVYAADELAEMGLDQKVRDAYPKVRELVTKIARLVDQHERAMRPTLRRTKGVIFNRLIRNRPGNMPEDEMKGMLWQRYILRQQLRAGADVEDQLAALEIAMGVGLRPEWDADLAELDQIDRKLARTSIQRHKGYLPHKFFGSWAVYRIVEDVADDGTVTERRELIPADRTGFHQSRMEAIAAAKAYDTATPGERLLVTPTQAGFGQPGMVLPAPRYNALMGSIERTVGLTGEDLRAAMDEAGIRRRSGRRWVSFKNLRKGIEGYSKDLTRVMDAHISEATRYVYLDSLKYEAIQLEDRLNLRPENKAQATTVAAFHAYVRDILGNKQTAEAQLDELFDKPWATPLNVGAGAGLTTFALLGGLTANPFLGLFAGSLVGYKLWQARQESGSQGGFHTRSMTGAITSVTAHLKLGSFFNVFSAVVNLGQFLTNTVAVLPARAAMDGTRRYAKAMAAKMKGQSNHDLRLLERQNINPIYNLSEASPNQLIRDSALERASMFLFQKVEQFNRAATFLGAYHYALGASPEQVDKMIAKWAKIEGKSANVLRDRNIERGRFTPGGAQRYAEHVMLRTQFDMSAAMKPEAMRNTLLRVPLQFKNYVAQQINFFMGTDWKSGETQKFLMALFLMAGVLGLPGIDMLDALMKWLFDWSPIAETKRIALKMAARGELEGSIAFGIAKGLPALMGTDISSRAGMGEAFLPKGQLSDILGPALGTFARAQELATKGASFADQLRNLSTGLGGPLKSLEAAANGLPLETLLTHPGAFVKALGDDKAIWTNPAKRGAPELGADALSTTDLVMAAVGGAPRPIARHRDFEAVRFYLTKDEKDARQQAYNQIAAAYLRLWTVDQAAFASQVGEIRAEAAKQGVTITPENVRNLVKTLNVPRAQREIKDAPKDLRPELLELQRGVR